MTVFAGLATVNDVAAVCAGADGGSVVDSLQDLVNANLVVVRTAEEYGTGHTLLETIQHYATRKLAEAGEADETRNRHLAYYADRAVEFIASVPSMGALAWAMANMRAAIEHGLATGADQLVITIYGTFGGLMTKLSDVDLHPAVEQAAYRAGGAFPAVVDYIHLEQVTFAPDFDEAARLTQLFLDTRTPDQLAGWTHYPVWSWVQAWSALFASASDLEKATRIADELADTDPDGWVLGLLHDVKLNIAVATGHAETAVTLRGPAMDWLHTGRCCCSTSSTGPGRRSRRSMRSTPGAMMSSVPRGLWRQSSTMLSVTRPEPTPRWRSHCGRRAGPALPLPRRWALTALAELQRRREGTRRGCEHPRHRRRHPRTPAPRRNRTVLLRSSPTRDCWWRSGTGRRAGPGHHRREQRARRRHPQPCARLINRVTDQRTAPPATVEVADRVTSRQPDFRRTVGASTANWVANIPPLSRTLNPPENGTYTLVLVLVNVRRFLTSTLATEPWKHTLQERFVAVEVERHILALRRARHPCLLAPVPGLKRLRCPR